MIATTMIVLLLVLLSLRVALGFTMAITGAVGLYLMMGPTAVWGILSSMPHDKAKVYEFLTIPMFLLMAEFVLRSGIADDLFRAAAAWFGNIRGGLGIATAFAGAGFGAICGSSTASAATLSSTSLPAMQKYGYEPRMAAGCVAISGTLAMLIPPSIAMIVYGMLADVGIARLLIAGVVPGLLVTLTIGLTVHLLARIHPDHAPRIPPAPLAERLRLLGNIGPILVLFMAVTGVIYTGVATPTEASAIGALAACILYFWRGRRTAKEFYDLVARATRTSCMIAIILLGAHIFSVAFTLTQATQTMLTWVGTLEVPSWIILAALVFIYLVLGMFLDQMAILVLTIPVVAPLVSALGYDLIWFGVLVIVTAEVGMVTPPVGLNSFVVSKYAKIPVADVFVGVWPHVVAHIVLITVLVLFPSLTLWLPNNM